MIADIYDIYFGEIWDMLDYRICRAFDAFTRESVISLIIQGVLIAMSLWDKNVRFFVVLSAIGIYSVYGNILVWVNMRRIELAEKRRSELKYRQYRLAADIRNKNLPYGEILFMPEPVGGEDSFSGLRISYTNPSLNYAQSLAAKPHISKLAAAISCS